MADRIYFSTDADDVNYVAPEQYALLLDVADFFTQENIEKYLVDFYVNKKPCCGRTIYIFFTRVLPNPAYAHLAHYEHDGKVVHVLELYHAAMASERRRNNDVFGRNVMIQVRVKGNEWVSVSVCQIMFCVMIHKMHLFDHIDKFMPEIQALMAEEEASRKETIYSKASLRQTKTTNTNTMDFYMADQDDWKIRMDVESDVSSAEVRQGIDFYMC